MASKEIHLNHRQHPQSRTLRRSRQHHHLQIMLQTRTRITQLPNTRQTTMQDMRRRPQHKRTQMQGKSVPIKQRSQMLHPRHPPMHKLRRRPHGMEQKTMQGQTTSTYKSPKNTTHRRPPRPLPKKTPKRRINRKPTPFTPPRRRFRRSNAEPLTGRIRRGRNNRHQPITRYHQRRRIQQHR
jgi:hypothetical protein